MTVTTDAATATTGFKLPPKVAMVFLGFASGLPFAVFTGTIIAWFSVYGIDGRSIGVFSMSSLPYVFKFLWAPLLGSVSPPFFSRLKGMSRLRSWILISLAVITPVLFALPNLEPDTSLNIIAALSLLAIIASATQDTAIGGWRIRIAKNKDDLNDLVAIEQFSYRTASFFGAAVALVIAQNTSWDIAWWFIAGLIAICFAAVFFVPDPALDRADTDETETIRLGGTLLPSQRRQLLIPVLISWGVSIGLVLLFMTYVLNKDNGLGTAISFIAGGLGAVIAFLPMTADTITGADVLNTRNFTLYGGPIIILVCVLSPVIAALRIMGLSGHNLTTPAPAIGASDTLYRNLLEPFIDFVQRFRWALASILFLTLFYRYADGVWGAFAYPFYLGKPEVNGGLGHSLAEVAAASKTFGVLMTITGVTIGGLVMRLIGQMPALVLGAVLAAATNLLYADLAAGGGVADSIIAATHIDVVFPTINGLVNLLSADADVVMGNALGRLMVVIAAENLAVGIASVVYVAYLSSIVNKHYAAVQFAILASLSLLVAVLGRGYLGQLIDERGFTYVFILTAVLGLLGVGAAIAEWVRVGGNGKDAKA